MILLEQHIELNVYHFNKLRKYDVVEVWKDDGGISFRIFYGDDYIFTLVPQNTELLCFDLSQLDKDLDIAVDWNLYAKIEAAIYSIFLREIPS